MADQCVRQASTNFSASNPLAVNIQGNTTGTLPVNVGMTVFSVQNTGTAGVTVDITINRNGQLWQTVSVTLPAASSTEPKAAPASATFPDSLTFSGGTVVQYQLSAASQANVTFNPGDGDPAYNALIFVTGDISAAA